MPLPMLMCAHCKHFDLEGQQQFICLAFPDGIPYAITHQRADHRRIWPGDHDIQFEPENEEAAELVVMMWGPAPQ